jgi:hypothetical protein
MIDQTLPVFRVEDFGATGVAAGITPTIDSSTAIQNALDAASLATTLNRIGGIVTFASRAYLIKSPLTVSRTGGGPIWIMGGGRTVLQGLVAGEPGTKLLWGGTATNVTMLSVTAFNGGGVSGLQLDCGASNPADVGLLVVSSVGGIYDGIDVLRANQRAYILRATSAQGVYRNTFSNLSCNEECKGGMLLESTFNMTDVASNLFTRLDLKFTGAVNPGLEISAGDTNQFVGLTVSTNAASMTATVPVIKLDDVSAPQNGAANNMFFGLDIGVPNLNVTGTLIQHDAHTASASGMTNVIVGLNYGNDVSAATTTMVGGSNPQQCFVYGAVGVNAPKDIQIFETGFYGGNVLMVRYGAGQPMLRLGVEHSSAFVWLGTNALQDNASDTQKYERSQRAARFLWNDTIDAILKMQVAPSGTATNPITWTDALTILASNGFVGIGTIAPAANLHIQGTSTAEALRIVGLPKFAGTNTTGAGSAALGSNSPATTNAQPYTWIKAIAADGSTVYIPAWK